jgi:thiamine monophosphate kinase
MEILNYLDFMHPMMLHTNGSADKSDGMVAALTNLCKYYRFKVNYDNYNVKPKV